MLHFALGRLVLLLSFILFCALITQGYSATLPPILMHSGWVTLKDIETRGDFKIFRRYGFIGDDVKNLIMFNCSRDASKAASHLTFVLLKDFQSDSFPRTTWLPKIEARFLINDRLSVAMPGEYRDGEFFFDLNTDTADRFDKLMVADTLALGFGEKNDVLQFQFTDRFDALFSDFVHDRGTPFGEMTHYSRAGAGSVTDACTKYQQSMPQTVGSDQALVFLFSQSSSASRVTAGALGFLTLTQCGKPLEGQADPLREAAQKSCPLASARRGGKVQNVRRTLFVVFST